MRPASANAGQPTGTLTQTLTLTVSGGHRVHPHDDGDPRRLHGLTQGNAPGASGFSSASAFASAFALPSVTGIAASALAGALALAIVAGGCGDPDPPRFIGDPAQVSSLLPRQVLPSTQVVLIGSGFRVGEDAPEVVLLLDGQGTSVPSTVLTSQRLALSGQDLLDVLGPGKHDLRLRVHYPDAKGPQSEAVEVEVLRGLDAQLSGTSYGGIVFLNDRIEVAGEGLLLGGKEGQTAAHLHGTFTLDGENGLPSTKQRPVELDLPVQILHEFDRRRGYFLWRAAIAGLRPGLFEGEVTLKNPGGRSSSPQAISARLDKTTLTGVSTRQVSLGQYVDLVGFGFVGDLGAGESTTVHLEGVFDAGDGQARPVQLDVVPAFDSGQRLRYVLNEEDAVGRAIDLRRTRGTLRGTATPVVAAGGDVLQGAGAAIAFELLPVRQIVWVNFEASYVASLRRFGLRAFDREIRERVLAVAARDYRGISVEFRQEIPADFFQFTEVDIVGPDPNGGGLLGYDNTEGKDIGNHRLYDHIGSVNAQTLAGGYPGYGGVFADSFLAFSQHPPADVKKIDGASKRFDQIFDPLREDRGGRPATVRDLQNGLDPISPDDCPAKLSDRAGIIACAVQVLGNLLGTTLSHELGHSLGLANPDVAAGDFHDLGDAPNRLMDNGGQRPFEERAELDGQGPAVFCDAEYVYLREILSNAAPEPSVNRPGCF